MTDAICARDDAYFPPILTTEQVADMTGLNRSWFDRARSGGYGPPYIQITSRIIRYERDVVLDWCRAHSTR